MDKLKVVVLTGNENRHRYYAKVMCDSFDVVGLITEPNDDYFVTQSSDSELMIRHLDRLKMYENMYLGVPLDEFKHITSNLHYKNIHSNQINSCENIDWVKSLNPDYILLYGTGILDSKWCHGFEDRIINLHLGMSPFYRGSATLFWPFYNDDLDHLGSTIHLATSDVDAGPILSTITAERAYVDENYYDITYKLIRESIFSIDRVVRDHDSGNLASIPQDISKQRYLYKKKDFTEECLSRVLEKYYGCQTTSM